MTGHNHYLDCLCGWCINHARSRSRRSVPGGLFRERDAEKYLERHSARSIAGCFVNPNARCPVCSASVFYFANAAGSRVFFDELGPPWPKHPCTDRRQTAPQIVCEAIERPRPRTRGLVLELIDAANTLGRMRSKVLGTRSNTEPTPLVVLTINRTGRQTQFEAEFLDSQTAETRRFGFLSDAGVLNEGDIISLLGDVISFVHPETLALVAATNGGEVAPYEQSPLTAKPQNAQPAPKPTLVAMIPATLMLKRPVILSQAVAIHQRRVTGDLTEAELRHFATSEASMKALLETYYPIVKRYAREGTRKPADVAIRLNLEGHRTLAKEIWTTRLAYFLLKLIFGDGDATRRTKPQSIPPHRTAGSSPPISDDSELPPNATVAEKLARLGRVIAKKSQQSAT